MMQNLLNRKVKCSTMSYIEGYKMTFSVFSVLYGVSLKIAPKYIDGA